MKETEQDAACLNQPAVTVIVPVYDGERFLAEALQSIAWQNYQPLEVLVVDDGSTDQSAFIAETFPITRVLRKTHRGLAATLNHSIHHATGNLFAFLDADDRWLPGKLARQVAELCQRPELDMVFVHARQFTIRQGVNGAEEVFGAPQPAVCKLSLLIRRASFLRVGDFSEEAHSHDFLDWYARALAANLQSVILPDVLVERRIHDLNIGRTDLATKQRKYLSTLRTVVGRRR